MTKTFSATSVLIGTIIGAGVLGIPYVVMQSGFTIGLIHLVLLAIILCTTMLYLGEIVLRTKTEHQLPGYAEKYLGKTGKNLMFASVAFGIYAAIIAYLIGEGESLSFIFTGSTGQEFIFGAAVWLIISAVTYFDLKALERGEEIGVVLIVILMLSIVLLFWNRIDPANLQYTNLNYLLTPFGVILFAYLGFMAIPELRRVLNKNEKSMKKSIILAHLICFLVYTLFAAVVLGYKGSATPQLATLALGKPFILLGMITMATSYLSLSISLMDTFRHDYGMKKLKAWFTTISIPIILFTILEKFNIATFTSIISIGGIISGGLTAIIILYMVPLAKVKGNRKPEYSMHYSKIIFYILSAIFVIGALAEIL